MILDLCCGTGSWSQFYEDRVCVDIMPQRPEFVYGDCSLPHKVVQTLKMLGYTKFNGILAAPPCDAFCIAGCKMWDSRDLEFHLNVVYGCLDIISFYKPNWWCLENPVGRLASFIGQPTARVQPYDYGDTLSKRTLWWGDFTIPPITHKKPPTTKSINSISSRHKVERSRTSPYLAKAFTLSNPDK